MYSLGESQKKTANEAGRPIAAAAGIASNGTGSADANWNRFVREMCILAVGSVIFLAAMFHYFGPLYAAISFAVVGRLVFHIYWFKLAPSLHDKAT